MRTLKKICLFTAKALGFFTLAKYSTRTNLRIICWHGFSTEDECDWAGGIMLHPKTLEKRLQSLTKNYTVLSLDDAVNGLKNNSLPRNAAVITLDDGFQGTVSLAHPLFKKYNVPYTLYLTTYYMDKDLPIVNLLLNYALWKTSLESVSLEFDNNTTTYNLLCKKEKSYLFNLMFQKIDALGSISEKMEAMSSFLDTLQLDSQNILSRPWLRLITYKQLQFLHREGVDIQLHTHKHCFPDDDESLSKEIQKNISTIQQVTGYQPRHICYPSGAYRENAFPLLEKLEIKSGTTCHIGINTAEQPPLLLKRFLDSDYDSNIEFEAHLCGFSALLKKILK